MQTFARGSQYNPESFEKEKVIAFKKKEPENPALFFEGYHFHPSIAA